ncbi:hypothetical protein BGW80DRAFT_1559956 [Lactifluus volemus]|nr:hypothetical protein BGW80DRAFT_1563848 [Lactifluus volemus]KAH9974464.1 hypothetical protein BGW80DRAFT_1559956 [Lactifluus volemus]
MLRERVRSVGIPLLGGNAGVEGPYELGIAEIRAVNEEDVTAPPLSPVPPQRKQKSSGFWGIASSFRLDRVPGWGESEKPRFVAPPLRNGSPGSGWLTTKPKPIKGAYPSTNGAWSGGSPVLISRVPGESVPVLNLGPPRATRHRKTRVADAF